MSDAAPTAAVLIIGDEILSGRTADTNLNTIARFLAALASICWRRGPSAIDRTRSSTR